MILEHVGHYESLASQADVYMDEMYSQAAEGQQNCHKPQRKRLPFMGPRAAIPIRCLDFLSPALRAGIKESE